MSVRVLSCVAAALLGLGALAVRPAKVDQQEQSEQVVEQTVEYSQEDPPHKVVDAQQEDEEEKPGFANMAEVEAPEKPAEKPAQKPAAKPAKPAKAAMPQKSKPVEVAAVQKEEPAPTPAPATTAAPTPQAAMVKMTMTFATMDYSVISADAQKMTDIEAAIRAAVLTDVNDTARNGITDAQIKTIILEAGSVVAEVSMEPADGSTVESLRFIIARDSPAIDTKCAGILETATICPAPCTATSAVTILQAGHTSAGLGKYHLAPVGENTCDFGVTVTETMCDTTGKSILADMKIKPGRDYLVSGSLANAPPGCSIHTLMDWAVTYNTNTQANNDGNYAEICHGKKEEVHGVKVGENKCDFGQALKVDKCLGAINSVMHVIVRGAASQTTFNVGHWDTRPPGCSMHVGAGSSGSATTSTDSIAFFNTKTDATNDGSYVLVCTGTVVPVR